MCLDIFIIIIVSEWRILTAAVGRHWLNGTKHFEWGFPLLSREVNVGMVGNTRHMRTVFSFISQQRECTT